MNTPHNSKFIVRNPKLKKIFGVPTDKLWIYPVLFGCVIRLYGITASSIWHDEGYTMWLLRFNPLEIIERTARDVHPPGYYLIAKPWVMLFGSSAFSIRMLSVLFSIGIIYLVYKIVELVFERWGKETQPSGTMNLPQKMAFWASMLVAFSPFMVRFAQEARMYGVVAFFTTLGTYFLVRFLKGSHLSSRAQAEGSLPKTQNQKITNLNKGFLRFGRNDSIWLILYALSMAAAIYTQYYAFFVIMIQWIVMAAVTPGFFTFKWVNTPSLSFPSFDSEVSSSLRLEERRWESNKNNGIFSYKWWLAGLAPLLLYLPWFSAAYKQVTRVGASYWIKPEWINVRTIPNNVLQFVFYSHLDSIYNADFLGKMFYWIIVLGLIGASLALLARKDLKKKVSLFLIYGYLPMALVFILSKARTPVYQDRYFPFSAVAILALWGIGIGVVKNKNIRMFAAGAVLVILVLGNLQMHRDTSHRMRELSEAVKKEMHPGDVVLSGELYTFLDGTYYFGDKQIKLISAPVDGYGETSLFYDRQDEYVVPENEAIEFGRQNRVFVIGKTGNKKYFSNSLYGSRQNRVIYEDAKTNGVKAVLYE